MTSLYENLAQRLRVDSAPRRNAGPRYDIGVLLFNYRDALNELWLAAEAQENKSPELTAAVDNLRALFGEAPANP